MRTITVEQRIGEKVGPIDWAYDFAAHGWDRGGSTNPKCIKNSLEMLRTVAADPERWQATDDGGVPRVGWGDVVDVGMYVGWPYWMPTPAIMIRKWDGCHWIFWINITDIAERQRREGGSK